MGTRGFPEIKRPERDVSKTKRGSRITALFPPQLLGAVVFCVAFILNCFEIFVMDFPRLELHTRKLEFKGYYPQVGR
jgi:hypothetical protein